ncbi:tc3a [Ecytonucleospora hepatopenaei]|uniref:Tc3a n=1 Tax=Ecytonucleospora hepatopenaei TaxID=646526 RepID=A0A1W0E8S3_9MICR|nr:tc3a [Ecytonucleospora hepatopenaei]
MMNKIIVPYILNTDENLIYQQDNASVHVKGEMVGFFEEKGITVLEWPSCSPDLNPIENLWGWLVRRVYESGIPFRSKKDLKKAILQAWETIPDNLIKKLVASMKKRCKEVLKNRGDKINY